MQVEAAKASGQEAACILLDLEKAFDKTGPALLWEIGCRHRFPKERLGLLIRCYASARAIKLGTTVSDAVAVDSGVTAGCGFATAIMKLFTLAVYDQVYALWPSITLGIVVDDASLQARGPCDLVVRMLVEAAIFVCRALTASRRSAWWSAPPRAS